MEQVEFYTTSTDVREENALEAVNQLCNPFSLEMLNKISLSKGMRIIDVGCGIGRMTYELAKLVGEGSEVYATDVNLNRLSITKELAEENNINHIQFIQLSATELEKLNKSNYFDLVYCRFVLGHLKQPEKTFAEMYKMLKPGGYLFCEDANGFDGMFCYPESSIYNRWVEVNIEQAKIHAQQYTVDFHLGRKLFSWYQKYDMKDIKLRNIQPLLVTANEKNCLYYGSIMTPSAQHQSKKLDLEQLINDNACTASFYPYIQVIGSK